MTRTYPRTLPIRHSARFARPTAPSVGFAPLRSDGDRARRVFLLGIANLPCMGQILRAKKKEITHRRRSPHECFAGGCIPKDRQDLRRYGGLEDTGRYANFKF